MFLIKQLNKQSRLTIVYKLLEKVDLKENLSSPPHPPPPQCNIVCLFDVFGVQ